MIENFKQKIDELMKADNYPEAFIYCGKALRENPHDQEVQQKALFIFKRIQDAHIEIEPNNAEEYTLRGIAFFYAGQIESSLYDYTKAIESDEKFDYAWKCRHLIYYFMKKLNLAERDIRKAIDLKPTGEYYNDLGNVLSMGDPNSLESLASFKRATEMSPENEMYWYNYGVDLGDKGRLTEAIEQYNKALELSPHFEDAIVNRDYCMNLLRNQ